MKLARARLALLTVGGVIAALPAPAHAAALAHCSTPPVAPLLSAFGDPRDYFVPVGGDFETPRWTLTGDATLTSGSGPLRLGAANSSLRLRPGASATSPTFCVDLDYPTMRFFSAQVAAGGAAKLNVDVIYPNLARSQTNAATVASGTSAWTLSKDVRLRPEVVDKADGWRVVQLRFSAEKAARGDWRVDDVLVDPRMRG